MSRYLMGLTVFVVLVVTAGASGAWEETTVPAADPSAAPAPTQLPAWMSVEVFKAGVAIKMTDAQKHAFNAAVGEYVTDYYSMVQKELMRNAPDLDMRIKSKDKALVHTMDDEVHKILTEEQWLAYDQYKKTLRSDMRSVTPSSARVPSSPRSGPSTGIPGGSIQTQD